jgi:hypothetical protein
MVNATMTAVYWSIGRRIVLEEQRGAQRAEYGEELIEQLAGRLTARFGRGFSTTNLKQMRSFYLAYGEIAQTSSDQSGSAKISDGGPGRGSQLHRARIRQTPSDESDLLAAISAKLPLPWSRGS